MASHLKTKNSRLKADEWAAKFVTAMWEQTLWIWQCKNDAFRADNEAQTKRYKLEALGHNKTQLRAHLAYKTYCMNIRPYTEQNPKESMI
jgi:hypothetical protein